jgi:aspartate aminotransferase
MLEETGVAMLTGECFGRDGTEYTARLAYVDFDGTEAIKSFDNGQDYDTMFPKMSKALDILKEWKHKN